MAMHRTMASRHAAAPAPVRLEVLGDFALSRDGRPVNIPPAEQRLLAYVACADAPVSRNAVVSALWPDSDPVRARGNLRTCLWRIRRVGPVLIGSAGNGMGIDPAVSVDQRQGAHLARRVLAGQERLTPERAQEMRLLDRDVLPYWFEEWVGPYRESYHRLRVRALEEAGHRLLDDGRPGDAVALAARAVKAEYLRDSAHWLLIRALMAEGNHSQAVEHYRHYAQLLETELGVAPPLTLMEVLHGERRP
jgi:DNA-binding SARP family transcriptional activator